MEIPYITKITINVGLGQAVKDKKSSWASSWWYWKNFWTKASNN
jgi:hypothetical protein